MKKLYNLLFVIFSILIFLALFIFTANSEKPEPVLQSIPVIVEDSIDPEKITREYGIPVDSFVVIKSRVRWKQSVSDILRNYHISSIEIDELDRKSKKVFDLRYFRAGNKYTVFCEHDSILKARYLVYEHTSIDYIVIEISDSVMIDKREKKVVIVPKISAAKIETNLWDAMITNDLNPMMSIELSEIYQWSIDFFGLQVGDHFTVIYDEEYVDTTSVGIGKIYTAVFNHRDKDFYAISFSQDSTDGYYDEEGNSLQRAFLKAPLRFSRISSKFSYSRLHPILKIRRPHLGVDYAAPKGTPVHSIGDGVVVQKKYTNGGGFQLKIKHNSIYTTGYLHLWKYANGLYVGKHVKQGEVIGYVGSTGLSTGPHLDFRVWRQGRPIDPLKMKSPPVKNIKKINKEQYEKIKLEWMQRLEEARKNNPELLAYMD